MVVEMENASTISWEEVGSTLRILAAQVRDLGKFPAGRRPQILITHPGSAAESPALLEKITELVPELGEVARVECVSVPGGRYYELKNAAIQQADGDWIVFLDSDCVPEPGWLATLLAPLAEGKFVAVSGHTYLGHFNLLSRTLALVWIFPLRDHDARGANRRSLNINNCAFQADWLRANPIPIDNGFKVGCTKLVQQMAQRGGKLTRVAAFARHAPLTGWRFFMWRALVTGRDADRKFADMKSTSRWRRLLSAGKFWFKMECRALRRVLTHHRYVAMPLWEVPCAAALGSLFYSLALLGQLARVAGWASDRPEFVPDFAKHS